MKSKIFISLELLGKTRSRLVKITEKWQNLPVKWIKEANLHITLIFLGFVDNQLIPEICEKVQEVCRKHTGFDLNLNEITLFPEKTAPRAVVFLGENNEELKNLANDLEKALNISKVDKKTFRPHLTLGRIKKRQWDKMDEIPSIYENFSLNLSIDNLNIQASNFEGGGGEYILIENCPLA